MLSLRPVRVKLLIVGASGLVGGKVAQRAIDGGMEVYGTYNLRGPRPGVPSSGPDIPCARLDVRDGGGVRDLVSSESPDAVINASALRGVDYCERHPEEADLVNASAVGVLADACADAGAKLVHISTDYVFDGDKAPYVEYDEPEPLNAYGYSKFVGEGRAVVRGHAVVRTSAVYGWTPAELAWTKPSSGKGANFALRLLKSLSAGKRANIAAGRHAARPSGCAARPPRRLKSRIRVYEIGLCGVRVRHGEAR